MTDIDSKPELQPGQLILSGKYRVVEFLGQGAFAQVYRARHLELKADRAVKVVSRATPGVGSTVLDDFRARFRQEAQLGARLDHPHVIRIYDFEEAEGRLYMVMEYAPGGSLASLLKQQGPLPVDEAVRLTLEAGAGLEALHQLGAVHRDVKPSNLLRDAGGRIKLTDLGLAQLPGGPSRRSVGGSLAPSHPGTPEYTSPEQESTSAFLTASSDVYSLGCVLFELLTGRLWKQAMAEVEDVRELRPEVPEGVAAALARMLCQQPGQRKSDAADPAKRYVTMEGVRRALQVAQRVAEQQARWLQLYQQGKDALARHDTAAGIAALQSLLAQAPDYPDAAALLADARAAQHRQQAIEQLTAQARQQQQAGDWAGLEGTARQLQPLSEPAAQPFLKALAAQQQVRAARRARLYEQGKRALERHDYAAAIASLQGLLAEAPDYAEATRLLADARAAAQRQQTIQQLTERAQRLQLAGDWPNLQAVERQLQPLSEPAARPFLEALAAEEQRQRAEAARRESERQAAEAAQRERERKAAEAARRERERQEAEAARRERERQEAEAAQRERERQLAAARYIPPEPLWRPAEPAARRRSGSGWLWGVGVLAAGLVAVWLIKPNMRPVPTPRLREPDGMAIVYVPAGSFLMGSPAGEGPGDEHPQHTVRLNDFWIDRTEVTNRQYEQCVQAGACRASTCAGRSELDGANHPVVCVDWEQARAYCAWVGARLPTEAEWEKAARGTDGRTYPWGNTFDGSQLNFCDKNCEFDWKDAASDDGYARTAPVGSYPAGASPYGALDMAGNVWEWVADWYAADYYSRSTERNPPGPDSGQYRVLRGGSWWDDRDRVRSALRAGHDPSDGHYDYGLRCSASSASSP